MAKNIFKKDPDARLDYTINWENFLETDTIVSAAWIVDSGITQIASSYTTTTTTIWVSGGTVGNSYNVTSRITTIGGRIEDQTIILQVVEK